MRGLLRGTGLQTHGILGFMGHYKHYIYLFLLPIQVSAIFKDCGIQNFSVQVEKEEYYQHMSGLSVTFDQMVEMTQQLNTIGQPEDGLYDIKAV